MQLIVIKDVDFDWLASGRNATHPGLRIAPGGAEHPAVLPVVQRMVQRLEAAGYAGSWMMVENHEVVGLCNFITPPSAGTVELGYGVAAARRRRGHATEAVRQMLIFAQADRMIQQVTASTAPNNVASGRVLETNGFVQTGTGHSPEDGSLIYWRFVSR